MTAAHSGASAKGTDQHPSRCENFSDKPYGSMVGKASDNFVAGSMHDTLWQTV